jgi:hypothetical protein
LCSTNGYSRLTNSETIPLGIKSDTAGMHVFTATLLNNFDSTTIIQLEDRETGVFTNLRNNFYAAQLADSQTINGRFFLHVSRAIQFSSVTAGCNNNDGMLQLNQDNSIQWTASRLYNSGGDVIDSRENIAGPYSFSNLPEGDYNLVMSLGDFNIAKSLHVPGTYVVTHMQASVLDAAVNQDITFYTTVHNGTNYQWELGDSTQITGVANPTYSYLQAGVYQVMVISSNAAGCQSRDSVTVTISAATGMTETSGAITFAVYPNPVTDNLIIQNTAASVEPVNMDIYNAEGQLTGNYTLTDATSTIPVKNLVSGTYHIKFYNNKMSNTRSFVKM